MGIQYHPRVGEALYCVYDGIEPEMVKKRLVVVVSPKAAQRHRLVTVVPISTTPPEVEKPWHVKLSRDPIPESKTEVWVKCDMINVVCFDRLWGRYSRWGGKRRYSNMFVSQDDLRAIRKGMAAALGLTLAETAATA
jgi:mRNA interferase MazF